jgi:O-antigen ligase
VLASLGAVALVIGPLLASSDAARQALARGDSYRLAIWQQFAVRVAERPWFGEGVLTDDSTKIATPGSDTAAVTILHPHDTYLATALYGGLPALLLLLGLVALGLRQGWRLAARGEPVWLLMLLFALLCMVTDGDRLLHAPRAIWFYFWLPVGVLIGRQARQDQGRTG